jgi:hypothetical protein
MPVVAAIAAFLAAAPASGQEGQVIRVLAVADEFHLIDVAENQPPQIGNRIAFSGSFYRRAGTKRGKWIGPFDALVTVTSPHWGYLAATGILPGGSIPVAGRSPLFDLPIERYAVIGGTGRYGARAGPLR